ncbi:MAG: hypothetical protein ACOX68_06230 [Candidatus Limivicinus sp.]|jgi:predicted small lipoprotein YifL
MKKIMSLVLVFVVVFAFAGCGKTMNIKFPFETSDVETIVIYQYNVPADAEKKTLTDSDDIEGIIDVLSGITLRDKKVDKYAGGTVTSFRFNLCDGTNYTIIYGSEAVKSGTLILPNDDTEWFTSADIGALWDTGDSDAVKADMSELPSIE